MQELPDARGFLRIAILAILLVVVPGAASVADVIVGPTLTMNPTGRTPLAGVVELETDTPVQAQLTITDGTDTWTVSFPDLALVHYLPVLGLKPDRSYTVDVDLIPGGFAGSLMTVTGPLPADFPVVVAQVSSPLQMEPGYTLIDCYRRDTADARPRYSMVVDSAGEVVWYSTICSTAFRQTVNGNLTYRGGAEILEENMLGFTQFQLTLEDPGTGLHHDHLRTPMGTYLSLGRQSILVPDYPTSTTDPNAPPADTIVRDEPVLEFFPDGTLRKEWLLTDIIETTRIGYDSLNQTADGRDWAHANAVVYDPSDDTFIASLRHQDAVIKFSRATGELVWILGPHDNWTAEFQPFLLHPIDTPFEWQYHQHAPMLTGDGTLVLFDNGNRRASPFDGVFVGPSSNFYSRGVEYEIDEDAMQVRQVWEFGGNIADRIYADRISDADWLETTGNVMMTFGSVSYTGGVASVDLGLGTTHARIIEATDAPTPETVFDLLVYDSEGGIIRVYRAERIPSLYPQQYVKSPNGVGNTLRASETPDSFLMDWAAPPEDLAHSPADHFIVYFSDRPDGGFQIMDTAIQTNAEPTGDTNIVFYKIVAANTAGTSGDEPLP